ncbi:sec-independent protein translocase protein TATC, chloroplastic [Silene latifolia]|uniref:sec-independent protein translocase protein TATC, chloroplastic n=1 Tax=Silene latifolia TaxID=37657 RepID=UPI003D77DAE8
MNMSGAATSLMSSSHLNCSTSFSFNPVSPTSTPRILPQILQTTRFTPSSAYPRNYLNSNRRKTLCLAVDDSKETNFGLTSTIQDKPNEIENVNPDDGKGAIYDFLYPSKDELPDDQEMSIFDHLEELRQRIFVSVLGVGAAILGCFAFSKDLIMVLEAPVKDQGVRFLQLAPGEFFFTTLKVSGYCGLLIGSPIIVYEIIAFVVPGLTRAERRFLGPIVLASSVLFYAGITFSYLVLTPAALNFFVTYAEGVVESLWSIDQYFEFVLVLMFSTGLSFQVPVIQLLLGQTGLVSGDQMLSIWRYVVVGAVVAAAILTPSTDPLTQMLLAGPLLGLYLGGAWAVKLIGR